MEVAAAPGGEVDPGYLQCKRVQAGNADFEGTGIMVKEVEKSDSPAVHDWRRSINSRAMVDSEFGDPVTRTPIDYAERPELRSEEAHRLVELAVTVELASSNFVRALVGAVYLHCGKKAAKVFIKEHILSRDLNYVKLFDFRQPTRELNKLCAREGFDPPLARILRESGRLTRSPVFIVGVFAGKEKLGEGIGGSLDEARIKAAIAALKGWYLYSPPELRVPSESEGPSAKPWQPVMIDGGDVVV